MPAGNALFGSSASRGQSKNLVEFKAGKMVMKGKMVHPDKRKGLVYIYQSEDSLMHFCWKDRSTGSVEDDLIIFPDDVEFKRVTQCTTGRVYLLKFKSSSRKFFFWIQEAKTDKDEDNCRKVNEVLNNPPSLGSQRSGGTTPDGDLQNLLSNMSQQQLMQLFGGVGQIGGLSNLLGSIRPSTSQSSRSGSSSNSGSVTGTGGTGAASSPVPATAGTTTAGATTATPAPTPAPAATTAGTAVPSTPVNTSSKPATPAAPKKPGTQAPIQLSHLQRYLSGLGVQSPSSNQQVDLSSTITAESLQAILNDPNLVRELQRHLPSVGGEANSEEQLRSTLASPQFQQAVSMFSTALQSGQLGPVVSQFEVGSEAVSAANQGNMEDFVRALQAATISQEGETKPDEKKDVKKDEDEDMNLD